MNEHRQDVTASLDQAEEMLDRIQHPGHGPAAVLLHVGTAIVYALFDIADAIREGKRGA